MAAHGSPEDRVMFDMDAVHARRILQNRQKGRPVTVLFSIQADKGRLRRKRVILLDEDAVPADGPKQLFAQFRDQAVVPVIFQSPDGPLVRQCLRLAAPVVGRHIPKQRIVYRDRWKRHMRPEFLRIQQMFLYETVGHRLGKAVPVHGPQIVMGHRSQHPVILVPVEAGARGVIPQIGPDFILHMGCLLLPERFPPDVFPDSADLCQRFPRCVGKAHNIHGSHGYHAASFRGHFLAPVIGGVPVPEGVIFSRVVFAPGLQTAVTVGIPHAP